MFTVILYNIVTETPKIVTYIYPYNHVINFVSISSCKSPPFKISILLKTGHFYSYLY